MVSRDAGPDGKKLEFSDENHSLNDEEMDWLLNSACYQIGLISCKDLHAIGNSIKGSYELLNRLGQDSKINIDESTWNFIAFEALISIIESWEARGDRGVIIARNTGLRRD